MIKRAMCREEKQRKREEREKSRKNVQVKKINCTAKEEDRASKRNKR